MPDGPVIANANQAPVAAATAASARDLAAILVPGAEVSARVLEALDANRFVVLLRGRTLIAESAMPLQTGEVVTVKVDGATTPGGQITARLLSGAPPATTATPLARIEAMGLPISTASTVVMDAFEQLGAPLDPARLRNAVQQISAAMTATSATATATAPATEQVVTNAQPLAMAHALLARANLPVTPPLLALAQRAAAGDLPNPAAALMDFRAVAKASGLSIQSFPSAATAVSTPLVDATESAETAEIFADPGAESADRSASVANPSTKSPGATTSVPVAGDRGVNSTATGSSPTASPAVLSSTATNAPQQIPRESVALGSAPHPVPVADGAAATAPRPSVPLGSAAVVNVVANVVATATVIPAESQPLPVLPGANQSPNPLSSVVGSGVTNLASPSPAATPLAQSLVWRAVLADPIPDGAKDGAPGIMRALALAGLRVSAASSAALVTNDGMPDQTQRLATPSPTDPPPRLTQHLAAVLAGSERQSAGTITSDDGRTQRSEPLPTTVSEAAVRVVHEQSAASVLPDDRLRDYDRVLPLPLMANGQPTPARLAVAQRPAPGGGTATFVRVDAELSELGPISVRLSGVEGGAMAITLVANTPAARQLAESLPDLAADLQRLGITAGVRVVSDDGSEHAGASSNG